MQYSKNSINQSLPEKPMKQIPAFRVKPSAPPQQRVVQTVTDYAKQTSTAFDLYYRDPAAWAAQIQEQVKQAKRRAFQGTRQW